MAKMKLKTHSGAKKRFKLTKNGKIKRGHAFRSPYLFHLPPASAVPVFYLFFLHP